MNSTLSTQWEQIKDNLEDGRDTLRRQCQAACAGTTKFVRREPHKALALAAVAGAVIAAILARPR
ncbi:MAG: DUF883 family protein [Zoogloeaceae bacterium]|nr:DUF883 family protein [Zoogloeaceae bacterium]